MKNWFLIAIAVFSYSVAYPIDPEKVEILSTKIILQNKHGYFMFSDGSCWKVVGFSKRWRSLIEWWNDVRLVPECYECSPNDWYPGAEIEIYPKYGNLEINETDAANQKILKQCTHFLVNSRTGQILLAISLTSSEYMIQLFEEGYKEGYSHGHKSGYTKGYQAAIREEGRNL